MSKTKRQDKWLQVGNFLLGVDSNAHGRYLVCKSVARNWSVRWGSDTTMFAMMLSLMTQAVDNDSIKEYLHSLVSVMFLTSSYTHDLVALATKKEMPFMEGVANLLKEQTDYEASLKEKPTQAQEDEALKEVCEMQEISNELEKLNEESK